MTPSTSRMRLAQRLLAGALALGGISLIASCGGIPPSPKELAAQDKDSRAKQVMRVADATRDGGDLKSAIALYQRAAQMRPDWPLPLIAIGKVAVALGDHRVAAESYRKAIALDPNNLSARLGYGKVLLALNRPDLAVAEFKEAVRIAPKDYRVYNGLGVAFDLLAEHQNAQRQYMEGLVIAPDNLSLRNNLALSMALVGDFDEATRVLKEIVSDPIATPRYRQNLALVYGLAGKMDMAAAIARADLSEKDVQNNLARYEAIRSMPGPDKARAIFGISPEVVTIPHEATATSKSDEATDAPPQKP